MTQKIVESKNVVEDIDIDKIYVICCDQSLSSMGLGHIRTAIEGVEESTMSLDWSNVRSVPVIATERVEFEAGDTHIVRIKPIKVPAKHAVIRSFYGNNGMGNLSCIGSTEFKSYSEDRIADRAMFTARIKSPTVVGDLLGHVLLVPGQ